MSKIHIVDDNIADINITTKRSLTPVQKKLIESLAYLQMMCVTTAEDEPDKLFRFIDVLSNAVKQGNIIFNEKETETFDVTEQF